MRLGKFSVLAVFALLSCAAFAVSPTVRTNTVRLGAGVSNVTPSNKNKAPTAISIGGGLNKLTSNRGQTGFTPSGLPSDKQSDLIENFQKEIQAVRDAVVEELKAQNDIIRDLVAIIAE